MMGPDLEHRQSLVPLEMGRILFAERAFKEAFCLVPKAFMYLFTDLQRYKGKKLWVKLVKVQFHSSIILSYTFYSQISDKFYFQVAFDIVLI